MKVHVKPGFKVKFSKKMLHMLGLDVDTPIFTEGKWRTESEPRLDPIEALYVYCDVVDHSMVGDVVTPLFRIVQVNSKKAELQTLSKAFIIIRRVGNASTPSKSV